MASRPSATVSPPFRSLRMLYDMAIEKANSRNDLNRFPRGRCFRLSNLNGHLNIVYRVSMTAFTVAEYAGPVPIAMAVRTKPGSRRNMVEGIYVYCITTKIQVSSAT